MFQPNCEIQLLKISCPSVPPACPSTAKPSSVAMANAEDQALRYAELIDMHSRDAAEFLEQWKTTVTAAMQASSERTVWVLDYGCGT
eukprot:1877686-Rhodomonas_salina.1